MLHHRIVFKLHHNIPPQIINSLKHTQPRKIRKDIDQYLPSSWDVGIILCFMGWESQVICKLTPQGGTSQCKHLFQDASQLFTAQLWPCKLTSHPPPPTEHSSPTDPFLSGGPNARPHTAVSEDCGHHSQWDLDGALPICQRRARSGCHSPTSLLAKTVPWESPHQGLS